MNDFDKDDQMLSEMFGTARKQSEVPSADLMARVLNDAAHVQAKFAPEPAKPVVRFGLRAFIEGLGGWPAMGGLVAATSVGFWLGVAPVAGLSEPVASYLFDNSDLVDFETDYVWADTFGDAL